MRCYVLEGLRALIQPDTRLVTVDTDVGDGVVATRWIPQGSITWVLDDIDRVITAVEVDALPPCYEPQVHRWTFDDGHGRRVLCWDLGRLMNHSPHSTPWSAHLSSARDRCEGDGQTLVLLGPTYR